MSQVSDAETVPGELDERQDSCPTAGAPASDSLPRPRALWTRPPPLPAPEPPASGPRPRTYRSLKTHMQLLPQQGFTLPRSFLPRGAGPAEMQYIPVKDAAEGLTYMMCSYCKGDRIYRVFQNFLRHLESGECPAGQQELLRIRSETEGQPVAPGSSQDPAPPDETCPDSRDTQEEQPGERSSLETSFRCRRQLLAELRLLQPKRYAELAVDALGLLNRSIQDLLMLLHRAREDPEIGREARAAQGTVAAPVKAKLQRHPVEALADRLKGQGFELRPLFSFDECRSEFYLREAKLMPGAKASASTLSANKRTRAPKRPCSDSQSQLIPLDLV